MLQKASVQATVTLCILYDAVREKTCGSVYLFFTVPDGWVWGLMVHNTICLKATSIFQGGGGGVMLLGIKCHVN